MIFTGHYANYALGFIVGTSLHTGTRMFYPLPKKIQLAVSQAKWAIQSSQSVLILVGLDQLQNLAGWTESQVALNLRQLLKRAQALDITVLEVSSDNPQRGLLALGQYLAVDRQLIMAGQVSGLFNQILQHALSVTERVCVIDDAILSSGLEQHIQWIDNLSMQNVHHMNSNAVTRLWSLSAPAALILSAKGIVQAVAEQLDLHPLEIELDVDLRDYGLDSVAMVTLIGLWRANGANITYEDFLQHPTLQDLLRILPVHIADGSML